MFWGFVGDPKLASYVGIIINHYKDPYEKTQYLMESTDFFVLVALMPGFFSWLRYMLSNFFSFFKHWIFKTSKKTSLNQLRTYKVGPGPSYKSKLLASISRVKYPQLPIYFQPFIRAISLHLYW